MDTSVDECVAQSYLATDDYLREFSDRSIGSRVIGGRLYTHQVEVEYVSKYGFTLDECVLNRSCIFVDSS